VSFLERRTPELALQVRQKLRATRIAEVVTKDILTARSTDAFEGVARRMVDAGITLVPVVEDDRVIGTLGYDAVVRALYRGLGESLGG
jgi:predicted transcriptional regulator